MIPTPNEKFQAPAGWRTHSFTNPSNGHEIHFGSVFPSDKPATAIVIALPGLSEFSEKYYEVAHDMLERGYAFWCIDWQYQGRSGRMPKHPQRRHSDGFNTDIDDLHKLIADYIKPASVHPAKGRTPMVMLAHSMGSLVGLQYLIKHPGVFDAAALSAPFLGIYSFSRLEGLAARILAVLPFINKYYVPKGKDWSELRRKGDGSEIFSSDPLRDALHGSWSKSDPSLQVGDPTLRWVAEALKSFAFLRCSGTIESIKIPLLVATAEKDTIVDNDATRLLANRLPDAEIIDIKGAKHEILMERDDCRGIFLAAFDKMIKEHKIVPIDKQ